MNFAGKGAVLLDSETILHVQNHRITTQYIGPVNQESLAKEEDDQSAPPSIRSATCFMIQREDGSFRRMNRQEKLAMKNQIKANQKKMKANRIEKGATVTHFPPSPSRNNYNSTFITNLKERYNVVPPAIVSVSLWPIIYSITTKTNMFCKEDEDLANEWAEEIRKDMEDAELIRMQEKEIRDLPYKVIPEVWVRLRSRLKVDIELLENNLSKKKNASFVEVRMTNPTSCRKRMRIENCIVHFLWRMGIYISCGTSFGCDYLLYHGRREDTHAFAGLRIIYDDRKPPEQGQQLPRLSPYDLTGYVRGLNTAGKLALVATAVEEQNTFKILIVDLVLEKVLEAQTHIKYNRTEKRKTAGQHLAKQPKSRRPS